MNPLISVIVPVYNVEKYLSECLESLTNQTFKDIEILCVNDGSTDTSPQILERFANKYANIKVIAKANGGLASARNAAIPFVQGKYIAYLDSDDSLLSNALEKLMVCAENFDADMTFFYFFQSCIENNSKTLPAHLEIENPTIKEKTGFLYGFNSAPWSRLWKTTFVKNNHLLFSDYRFAEDQPTHWKSIILANRIAVCPEKLYYYRPNPNSLMGGSGENRFCIIEVYQEIKQFLLESNEYNHYQDIFLYMELEHLFIQYLALRRDLLPTFRQKMKSLLSVDELNFIHTNKLPARIKNLFFSLEGNRYASIRLALDRFISHFCKKISFNPKAKLKQALLKRLASPLFQRDEVLCRTIADLRQEMVRLRGKYEYKDTKGK